MNEHIERPHTHPHMEDGHTHPHETESHADGLDRRSFLKIAGFTVGTAVLAAGCQQPPLQKAIPYLNKPPEMTPGQSEWYASTCAGCTAGCGILIKNRDGRPIKIEGNPDHPVSKGGACVVGQASLLGLYDSLRLREPLMNGRTTQWGTVDSAIATKLAELKRTGGQVRFLSGTITSPTLLSTVSKFLGQFQNGKHVSYDALSACAILDAHLTTHGVRLLPHYLFDKAEVIVSVDADFLGTWISPVEFTAGYRAGRMLDGPGPRMSYHVQCESRLSLTGSNADKRYAIAPSQAGILLAHLALRIASLANQPSMSVPAVACPIPDMDLQQLAARLWEYRGKSLVISGANDPDVQITCNIINSLLSSYGNTIDITYPSMQKQGSDAVIPELMDEMQQGRVAALFIHGVNPVYDTPDGKRFAELMKKVPMIVAFAEREDETASIAHFVCPDHHPLESWSDVEAVTGVVSVAQPTIRPLGQTRSILASLATWMGAPKSDLEIVRSYWKEHLYPKRTQGASEQTFWDDAVRNGFTQLQSSTKQGSWNFEVSRFSVPTGQNAEAFALLLYPHMAMLDGRHAHNPWLHELPDPISKITWDNYASVSASTAAKLGVEDGDMIRLSVRGPDGSNRSIELPVLVQEGQHEATIAIALGYGRKGTNRFTEIGPQWLESKPTISESGLIGTNAAPLLTYAHGCVANDTTITKMEKTGKRVAFARTQIYQSTQLPKDLTGNSTQPRALVQTTTFAAFAKNPAAGSFEKPELSSLWPEEHKYTGHRWGLAIDLTACTGCSACVVSCQVENNIPVVGKDEVRRNREMQWLRIDRYYTEEQGDLHVAHQPVMCQHCGNAPCETVCPVLATVHSDEGLNQQVYNRCVGTRYCANNCPYKIRRFNWFNYRHDDEMQNLVLNPDVTVRMRGVMEKCTFCVQRIQEGKIEAKSSGVPLKDGAISPACVQSCPAQAMVFGDMNDPKSRISQLMHSPRSYRMLEEIGVRPSVHYLTRVRNSREEGGTQHG